MTHEELVENVAEAIYREWAKNHFDVLPAEWSELVSLGHSYVEIARAEAREAIRITGEACMQEVPSLAAMEQYGTSDPALSEGFAMPQSAFKKAIKSLTQGNTP